MSFSGWSLLDPFTRTVQSQGSNLVLNFFFGPIVNAANAIAVQVSNAVNSFTQNISVAFRPQIIQSYSAEDYIRAKKLLLSMTKINFVLQTLLTIPVVFELSFLLTLWLGDGFPDYTIPFACFVMIDHMIGCFHEPISIIMSAKGDIKLIKSVSAVIMCSAIPLSIVLFNLNMSPIWIYILILVLSIFLFLFKSINNGRKSSQPSSFSDMDFSAEAIIAFTSAPVISSPTASIFLTFFIP